MSDKAYDALIAELLDANKNVRLHSLRGQAPAVNAVVQYLAKQGAPQEAIRPLIAAMVALAESDWGYRQEGKSGRKYKGFRLTLALSNAAAITTLIRKRHECSVDDALARVSRASGISAEEIRNHRKSCQSHTAEPVAVAFYKLDVEKFAKASDAELDARLENTKEILKTPPS